LERPIVVAPLDYDRIEVIGTPTGRASSDEVDAAERTLGIRFPAGYREYVTRFGAGVLGGTLVRIYVPQRILTGYNNVTEWRARLERFWFWDEGRDVLTRDEVRASVIIGDTLQGDELIVSPAHPGRIYVLPHDDERIYLAGEDLPTALEWLCGSGVLTEAFPERRFEPDPP
jgi:hypothetical protein